MGSAYTPSQNAARAAFLKNLIAIASTEVPCDQESCSICCSIYEKRRALTFSDSHYACKMPCGHFFGYACITTWLNQLNVHTCPMCRFSFFDVGDIEKLAQEQVEEDAEEIERLTPLAYAYVHRYREDYMEKAIADIIAKLAEEKEPDSDSASDSEWGSDSDKESLASFAYQQELVAWARAAAEVNWDRHVSEQFVPDKIQEWLEERRERERLRYESSDENSEWDSGDEDELGDASDADTEATYYGGSDYEEYLDEDLRGVYFGLDVYGADDNSVPEKEDIEDTHKNTSDGDYVIV
ncbi:hypothetical protein BU23DRAFT_563340 [Bimuria novae-zelandiae CBS 107.79]|uniref:RING-type domain-containing protein n=1 Tax=Bimuria novae-zelandiae CBS 107.79 TaxID=1447943 RepID=A0A6A5VP93_9PLEO|nr:hypothetical protein BU23DRAFT_563340 [Bimuria novae-zelandiae CBS 107.79]